MERLTKWVDGEVQMNFDFDTSTKEWKNTPKERRFRNGHNHIMLRLAAYEDTGLLPDEAEALKSEVERLKKIIDKLKSDTSYDLDKRINEERSNIPWENMGR